MKQLVREQYDNFKDWLINEDLPTRGTGRYAYTKQHSELYDEGRQAHKWDCP